MIDRWILQISLSEQIETAKRNCVRNNGISHYLHSLPRSGQQMKLMNPVHGIPESPSFCIDRAPKFPPYRPTILLAEDSDDLREVMGYSLKEAGYSVIACADGELALDAFHTHPSIDILMTDIEMPRKSGLELARDLRAFDPLLPVMIVSGSILSDETLQEMQDCKWTYMSKPCILPQLLATLQSLLIMSTEQASAPISHLI